MAEVEGVVAFESMGAAAFDDDTAASMTTARAKLCVFKNDYAALS